MKVQPEVTKTFFSEIFTLIGAKYRLNESGIAVLSGASKVDVTV